MSIWYAESGKREMALIGHSAEVSAGRFNYRGDLVVSGSMDGTMRLWDTKSGAALVVFRKVG